LTHHWLALFLTILIFIFSIILALNKSKKFHLYFDKVLMKIPVLGNIIQSYNLANITRTLGLLLKSGVPIGESIEISAKICANLIYKEELGLLAKIVDRGERISVYLSTSRNLFPDILTQIISVGERSGNLPHSLIYLSELYEAEVDDFTKNLSSTIEPLLMIVMGIMVGFIAVSIITPIYGITQHLQPK
jgi:type IV pilus assembly protein PilC